MPKLPHPPKRVRPSRIRRGSRFALHTTFRIGVALKGVDGGLETIAGVLIWCVTPAMMERIARIVLRGNPSWSPFPMIGIELVDASRRISVDSKVFASLFLLSHGLAKIVMVIALWMNRIWAYPLTMAIFALFCVYQIRRIAEMHSVGLMALTVLDAAMILLTWREYRERRAGNL